MGLLQSESTKQKQTERDSEIDGKKENLNKRRQNRTAHIN